MPVLKHILSGLYLDHRDLKCTELQYIQFASIKLTAIFNLLDNFFNIVGKTS